MGKKKKNTVVYISIYWRPKSNAYTPLKNVFTKENVFPNLENLENKGEKSLLLRG